MAIAIVDCRISEKCERALMLRGFTVIKTPPSGKLGVAVASHPDMLMFNCGNELITSADYCDEAAYVFSDLREYCPRVRITFTDDVFESEYPRDAIFNALVCGEKVFCRTASVSPSVLKVTGKHGFGTVDVKQGYPACTVLKLSEEAAITADPGMAKILREHGIRVTLIKAGGISLPPHEYGFIGGAGGVCKDKLYFFGDYRTHPSADIIRRAADELSYSIVTLCDGELRDFGGIVFL